MDKKIPLRILLVESGQDLAAAMLAGQDNFEIIRAERLTAAVRYFGEQHSMGRPCDILVLDLTTSAAAVNPLDQGLDAFRLARALFPGTAIVTLGSRADGDIVEEMISEGAEACLKKEGLEAKNLIATLKQSVLRNRAEMRRFRSLFDSAPIGIILAVGRRVVMANPDALATLGRSQEDLIPLSVLDLFPIKSRATLEKALDANGKGEIPEASFDADLARVDGTVLPCRVFVKGALLNNAPAVALYLAPLDKTLQRSDPKHGKMEALERMAGGVAHDFNNLLTTINGYSEYLLTLAGESGPMVKGLNAIRSAGEIAADLTRRLISFSGNGETEDSWLPVDEAIRQLTPRLQAMMGERIQIVFFLGAGDSMARLKPSQFDQILINLSTNAKEAMPKVGVLRITTRLVERSAPEEYTHLASKPGCHIVIDVEDTGIGMDSKVMECLFEPFFTTKSGGRGTGLGLATVYGILNQTGGGISVSSTQGHGTRFRVHLFSSPIQKVSTWEEGKGSGESILVVDDDSSLRDMLKTVLQRYGYSVMEAKTSEEAFELVKFSPGGVDLVLSDIMLHGEGGHELGKKLKKINPSQKMIFISGYSLESLEDRDIFIPADTFLEKPFTPSQLAAKVRTLLDKPVMIH